MRHLGVNLCAAVTTGELFRIRSLDLGWVLHPDDLIGLENLIQLEYWGILDYLDFSHTPALRSIGLDEPVESLPDSFTVAALPQLENFYGEFRGAAACRLLERETLRRVFGDVGQWPHTGDFNDRRISLRLVLPDSEAPDNSCNNRDQWNREITAAILDELGLLDAAEAAADEKMMQQYGPDVEKTFRDNYGDRHSGAAEQARRRAELVRQMIGNQVQVSTSSNLAPCEYPPPG